MLARAIGNLEVTQSLEAQSLEGKEKNKHLN
jgi:hypothetical protein